MISIYKMIFNWLHWIALLFPMAVLLIILIKCEAYPHTLIENLGTMIPIILISIFILCYLILRDCKRSFKISCLAIILLLFTQFHGDFLALLSEDYRNARENVIRECKWATSISILTSWVCFAGYFFC